MNYASVLIGSNSPTEAFYDSERPRQDKYRRV